MGKATAIGWTRSTFNPWIGCTKVGPGCDACYAEALDARMKYGKATHWGAGVPRYRTKAGTWNNPHVWNKLAGQEINAVQPFDPEEVGWHTPGFWPVFCASLADVFDNEAPQDWRNDLWRVIEATPNLSWLLVTKRIGNAVHMLPDAWTMGGFPDNVRILITVCNQEEVDRDVPKLLALPVANGISYEPALGPVDWVKWLFPRSHSPWTLQWIIVGGESTQGGRKARPFVHGWARDTVRQCKAAGVPVFVKQMGSNAVNREGVVHRYVDRAGADPSEWSEDLRVQEFPR